MATRRGSEKAERNALPRANRTTGTPASRRRLSRKALLASWSCRPLLAGDCQSGDRERQRSEAGSERPPVPMQDAGTGPAGGAAAPRPTQQRAGSGAGACHCCSSRGAAAWTCAFAARPRAGAQELAAGALARVKAGVVCCPGCRPLIGHSSGGCCGTRGAASTGKGARMQAECQQGFPSVRSIRLAWWSTGPRCGLTDDFSAPCWSVRRIPTHGRPTPCGN
jgi:hypothetical protein